MPLLDEMLMKSLRAHLPPRSTAVFLDGDASNNCCLKIDPCTSEDASSPSLKFPPSKASFEWVTLGPCAMGLHSTRRDPAYTILSYGNPRFGTLRCGTPHYKTPTYGILRYGNLRYQSDEGNYNHVITMGLRRRKHIYRYHDVRDEEETARRKTNLLSDRL